MYREHNDKRWYPTTVIQQLLEKRSYLIKTHDNVVYRKMQVLLKPYTPEKKIKPREVYKKDNQSVNNNQSTDNNQSVNNNQRPKHNIKLLNRLDL